MEVTTGGDTRRPAVRALTEFIVIVVGVLVAFAVDDWATRRADRLLEIQYLDALASDLRRDSVSLSTLHIPNLAGAQATLESLGPVLRGEAPFPSDTIAFLLEIGGSHRTPFLFGGPTFDELLSTGSLRLIESADLRSAIVAYYRFKELAITRDESRASGYADLVRAILPEGTNTQGQTFSANARTEETVRRFGVRPAAEAVQSLEFVRAVNRHLNYLGLMRPTLDDLLRQVQDAIPQVDSELRRLR